MKKVEIRGHVRAMTDADGAVLLDLKIGKYYSLNTIGAQIWNKAEEGLSLSEILDHLKECFPVPPERLESDLANFIDGLQKKDLIRVHA